MESEKPSRDFKFSSKTGAYRIIECRIVECRLRGFLNKEIWRWLSIWSKMGAYRITERRIRERQLYVESLTFRGSCGLNLLASNTIKLYIIRRRVSCRFQKCNKKTRKNFFIKSYGALKLTWYFDTFTMSILVIRSEWVKTLKLSLSSRDHAKFYLRSRITRKFFSSNF